MPQHRFSAKQHTKERSRVKPLHVVLATAILGLLVMPLGFAAASDSPTASKSASVRVQVKKLKQRIAALEQAPQARPSGPAGGDLTGNFPNPQIGEDAITSSEVAPDSLTGVDVATDSLFATDLGPESVRASELGPAVVVSTDPVAVPAGQSRTADATCPAGTRILSGGAEWAGDSNGASIIYSAPSIDLPGSTWAVKGRVDGGGAANAILAHALCLL